MKYARILGLGLALVAPSAAHADPEPRPTVRAVRTHRPPVIDGQLTDGVWASAPPAEGFTQKFPEEGAAPSEPTHFRILYDDRAIYVGVECEQRNTPLRAVLTRRDREVEADRVTIHIGSRQGEASAYQFGVNAAGVLSDALQFDDSEVAPEWDENWEAQVASHEHGWSAEIRVPLQVFRFEAADVQQWAFNLRRVISFRQEVVEWAHIRRIEAAEVSRYGHLEGLHDLHPVRPIQVRPYLLGKLSYFQEDFAPQRGFRPRGAAGVDLKWQTGDLTVEATVLPDFGQVEVDQEILNLTNQETFYPEKRPFFAEGLDLFMTPLSLVHTRRIGEQPPDPTLPDDETPTDLLEPSTIYGAFKLTGRASPHLDVGLLSAVTGNNRLEVQTPIGEIASRTAAPLSTYNVLRARHRFSGRSQLGLLVTGVNRWEDLSAYPTAESAVLCPGGERVAPGQRCFHDGYVAAIDGRWRSPLGDYLVSGQVALSLIHGGPPRTMRDGTVIASGDIDREFKVDLTKQGGERWLGGLWSSSTGRRFDRNDLGFMRRQNDLWIGGFVTYRNTRPSWGTLESQTGPSVVQGMSLDGTVLHRQIEWVTSWRLKNFWTLALNLHHRPRAYDDREIGEGSPVERASTTGADFSVGSDPRRAVRVTMDAAADFRRGGRDIALVGNILVRALPELDFEVLPELRQSRGLIRFVGAAGPNQWVFGDLHAASAGSTLRATYTFTPRLTLQGYVQLFLSRRDYPHFWGVQAPASGQRRVIRLVDLTTAAVPSRDPRRRSALVNVNLVLRWEYRLGSTLFLVYQRAQRARPFVPAGLPPRLDLGALGDGPAGDTILLKLSHWWG